MSRVSGSYASVVRGVSEQVPQDRRPGQVYDQINFISDPVRGLARRHGSQLLSEQLVRAYTATAYANMLNDTANHKVYPFQSNGRDYDLIYRTVNTAGQDNSDLFMVYDKAANSYVNVVSDGSNMYNLLASGGVSAIANVGTYLLIAGNNHVSSTAQTDTWQNTYGQVAMWVRAGAYARTYTVTITSNAGVSSVYSYTTPTSAYPGTLSTSDIPSTATDYTKQVNDRVNAYNSLVTQWIGTAAAAIVPRNIAVQVATVINAGGIYGCAVVDSTIIIINGNIKEVACADGGDGTLFRAVGNEVSAPELVSTIHVVGKVIRVKPKRNDGTDVFYLKAISSSSLGAGNIGPVSWRECAGYESTPTAGWCIAKVHSNGQFYVAADGNSLAAMGVGAGPLPIVNGAGDRTSNPVPAFIGKKIDFMGVFQDRLVVGSGAVLNFSRTGDYQNFWRQSVLTVDAADPVEMYALGAEEDTIRTATTYDRNLLLFGKRKQYVVSGRQPLTPSNASIVAQSSHEGAVDSFPVNSGNYVFYNKYRNGTASMHQVQIGQLADTPESYEVSKQLDRYLIGKPQELVAMTSPNMVFMRTKENRDRLYVYSYLDTAGAAERLFDSWSTWSWNPAVGRVIGISKYNGDLIVYMVKYGQVGIADGSQWIYKTAEKFVLDTNLSDLPYLDSLRLESRADSGSTSIGTSSPDNANLSVAFDNTANQFLLGTTFAKRAQLETAYPGTKPSRWAGYNMPASVIPTNPYVLDSNSKAVINGRLTIVALNVSIADSGGITASVSTANGTVPAVDFTGRVLGRDTNLVGRQPIVTTSVPVPIGRETREFTYTLSAHKWLPCTITAIEWRGQFFNNIRRI